ncbi:hypothetical protein DFH07DRAFT_866511 [Mycena maculata]|uniref:Uncharacterized protein n=1 Tax=Mycena maculata TaxID=230809 RepID=A0AAD7JX08_9AGAR|nr:hypothetical protein DFH07DRAFT_866511 [Mycena maculata]
MHLIYENVIKNLILRTYKNLDQGTGEYELNPSIWDAIGAATAAGGSTIPTAFGSKDRTACTADTWSFWLLYLGPVLLHNKFKWCVYYDHFIKFVKLTHLCLQFEYTKADMETIWTGFARWVEEYEKLYYQYSPDRLSACPLTIHVLLHIADGIEAAGPVWAYWAFPMERFCGQLQPCIKSRRFPFASIDGYVVATVQLGIIKVKNAIDLRLGPPKLNLAKGYFSHSSYPTCVLLPPHENLDSNSLDPGLVQKIAICLSTRYDQNMATICKYFKPENVQQWAKIERLEGGDCMLASAMIHAEPEDRRDATYVRYVLLVDVNARRLRTAPRYEPTTFYGQLQNLFVIKLPPAPELELEEETTLILAAVQKCAVIAQNDLDMQYYEKEGPIEVIDMSCIQCLVGRVKTMDRKRWAIIDHSGSSARPYYDPDA